MQTAMEFIVYKYYISASQNNNVQVRKQPNYKIYSKVFNILQLLKLLICFTFFDIVNLNYKGV